MPRPRLPTELLQLHGAFEKNPSRRRPIGPKSELPIGEPPDYFADDERQCWAEVEAIAAAGVLTAADRFVVELLARLVAKLRRSWLSGAEMSALTWCCSRLGMTPSDRSRVTGGPPPVPDRESPWSKLRALQAGAERSAAT